MTKGQFKTIEQVWEAIDDGERVFCTHTGYEVLVTDDPYPAENHYSQRNGQMLRTTCLENWFGSRLHPNELVNLFTLNSQVHEYFDHIIRDTEFGAYETAAMYAENLAVLLKDLHHARDMRKKT